MAGSNEAVLLMLGQLVAVTNDTRAAAGRTESAVTSQGERLGKVERDVVSLQVQMTAQAEAKKVERDQAALARTTSTSPWVVAGVVAAFASSVIAIIAIIATHTP